MLKEINCKCEIIKNFSPSWFASVMGTGVFAITSMYYSEYIGFLKDIAQYLFYLNVGLFFILLIPWIMRWILYRPQAIEDLENPIVSNFYSTIAIAMLVLSVDFMFIGRNMVTAKIFWVIGTILTVVFGIVTPFIMFRGEHVRLDHINPAWFIPPVGLIVIPLAGSGLIEHFHGWQQSLMIVVNFIGWGSGFFIYLALLAICVYRFILHHPLPDVLAPTIWINLGPIGAGTVALINLVKNTQFITIKEPFYVFGLIFWGFGIWWFLLAILMTLYYVKKIRLPYALSWWAFTFPLGAYIAASYTVAGIFNLEVIKIVGFAAYWLLFFLWTVTFVRTLVNTYHGRVFK